MHVLRRAAAGRFTRADQMWFTRPGLEQATTEGVARHRADRLAHAAPWGSGGRLWDLCCGIGGDLLALSRLDVHVSAVDLDAQHLRMAGLNAAVYDGRVADLRHADVRDAAVAADDVVMIDPARREGGRRLSARSEPPLAWTLQMAERVAAVVVKARPGLPAARVPDGWEREVVSLEGTLRESCLWGPSLATATARATVLPAGATLARQGQEPVLRLGAPADWVLDPDPAVTRAGLVRDLAEQVDAWQIDERIAFLSAAEPRPSPLGRWRRVEASLPWHERRVAAALRALDLGVVDVRRRGLPGDTDRIARRLRGAGSRRGTVLMTRHQDQPWCLITVERDSP